MVDYLTGEGPYQGERAEMVDRETIRRAMESLLQAAPAGSEVILFGSYARGRAYPESDLDFLVIEPEVRDSRREMVRLRLVLDNVIGTLLIPADVLVVSRARFDYWRDTPNTVYHEAASHGMTYERIN